MAQQLAPCGTLQCPWARPMPWWQMGHIDTIGHTNMWGTKSINAWQRRRPQSGLWRFACSSARPAHILDTRGFFQKTITKPLSTPKIQLQQLANKPELMDDAGGGPNGALRALSRAPRGLFCRGWGHPLFTQQSQCAPGANKELLSGHKLNCAACLCKTLDLAAPKQPHKWPR